MKGVRTVVFAIGLAVARSQVTTHDTMPGYLELRETGPESWDMLWKQPTRGELDRGLEPVFSPDCTVGPPETHRSSPGALVSRATIRCEFGLAGTTVEVTGLAAAQTDVLVRVYHADGRTETHLLTPSESSAAIGGTTSGVARGLAHFRLGVEHILQGIDHLLFVLGLLLIVPSRWMLFKTITAFTVAHSITLAVATLGYAHAPALPLNASIALSILFLGPEIVRARRGGTSLTLRHPWIVAFAFGLLHGFGFASGLLSLGLPAGEIPLALLCFNLGVEAGQLAFVALILALERAFRVLEVRWPAWVAALPAYVVGSLGAYWTIERTALLLGSWR
jgi:HupE/UreJ protein